MSSCRINNIEFIRFCFIAFTNFSFFLPVSDEILKKLAMNTDFALNMKDKMERPAPVSLCSAILSPLFRMS